MAIADYETSLNIFKFATKELAQDAAFAYILQSAHPEYPGVNAKMRQLGTAFLRAVLESINNCERNEKVTIPQNFETVCVETQEKNMDVTVRINDEIFLIIEDKVDTGAHSEQIKHYKEEVKKDFKNSATESWKEVVAVYMKTGNESPSFASEYADGVMYRGAILEVLRRHTDTGDAIVDQFRGRLEYLEDCTNAWKTYKFSIGGTLWEAVENNPWERVEGYYMELEKKLKEKLEEKLKEEVEESCYTTWHPTTNPGITFLAFGFGGGYITEDKKVGDRKGIIGQIQHGVELRLFAYKPFETCMLWKFLEEARKCAKKYPGMQVDKPPRLAGGKDSASFAVIRYGEVSYLALKGDGTIDFDATLERLSCVGELLHELVGTLTKLVKAEG